MNDATFEYFAWLSARDVLTKARTIALIYQYNPFRCIIWIYIMDGDKAQYMYANR